MVTLMLALVLWAPQTIVKCNGKLHPQGCAVSDSNPEPPMTCDGNLIHQECHYPEWFLSKKPEPMDVPAVKEYRWEYNPIVYRHCRRMETSSLGEDKCFDTPQRAKHEYWTCADKSRILLTAEDGSKHCIKFPKD